MKRQRNYRREYQTYHKNHLKDNNARHRARYAAEKEGKVRVGDGKEVHHKDNNPRNNAPSNRQVTTAKVNKSKPRRKI